MSLPDNDDHLSGRTRSFAVLSNGSTVLHYRIVHPIDSGGMGDVYLAEDTKLRRPVALKFLSDMLTQQTDARERFLREAQAVARLTHPNIVTVHEVADLGGRPFIVMEHVDGKSLKVHASERTLDIEEIVSIAVQCCDGIQAAHDKGIIHRDIKPANILVDDHGRVRIVDFGLASVYGGDHLTKTGSTLGTIGYMSPEQVYGYDTDTRSDLFSLGVVLYELCTGSNPFRRNSEAATLHAITHDDAPPVKESRSDIPEAFAALLDSLLAKDPNSRPGSALEARQHLIEGEKFPGRSSSTAGDRPSIAVLPFVNLSAEQDQDYFCDGITEDIINDLNHVPGLRVVARTSAFAFKNHTGDISEIGRRLRVRYVLEGSVRKAGNRVRITAQLIEVASGFHFWSDRYDRELSDIFAIQDDIARAIVEKLKLELDRGVIRRASRNVPLEAYQLFSRARFELNHRTATGFEKADEYLKQCLRLAPDFPDALAAVAETYLLRYAYDYMSPRDAVAHARTAAQRALELDDQLADAHATMGGIHTYYDWAWRDAERAFQRALELNSGHATAHLWYGELLTYLGREDEALQHLGTAKRLDPLSVVVHTMLGWHHIVYRRYQQALTILGEAVKLGSTSDFTYILSGWCHVELGQKVQALENLQKARQVSRDSTLSVTLHALGQLRFGDPSFLSEMVTILRERQITHYVSQPYLAALYNLLGDVDTAVELIQDALRRRDSELIFCCVMPYHAPLRNNTRIAPLLSVLGLHTVHD